MSKLIYVCARRSLPQDAEKRLTSICATLAPDNITPRPPRVVVQGNVAWAVTNPTNSIQQTDTTVLFGQIYEEDPRWMEPEGPSPDGSYALFRNGPETLELISDPAASRTIWYYMDEEVLIASTSQRAIVMFAGSYDFNEAVIPWMISTGSLGPGFSWDKKINQIPPDSSAIINKREWSVNIRSSPIEFNKKELTDRQHKKKLLEALQDTFHSFSPDFGDWVLPLSGGYDSRGILRLLGGRPRTITWGLRSALNEKGNDAQVARELAEICGVPHIYYHTDLSEESIDVIVDRFIRLGEGRIDHLSGYMDGFNIWKVLHEEGAQGVIRGDEGFGWIGVSSPLTVKYSVGCALCSDYSNLDLINNYDLPPQDFPVDLLRRDGETLAAWRDRLYHGFRMPTVLSALSDLKISYVELINPLLSRRILQCVRGLPDHLRTEKKLFKKIVNDLSPKVNYAGNPAIASPGRILSQAGFVDYLKDILSSDDARSVLPEKLITEVTEKIRVATSSGKSGSKLNLIMNTIKRALPGFVKNAIRDSLAAPGLDPNVLAFRLLLLTRMNALLKEDSQRVPQG